MLAFLLGCVVLVGGVFTAFFGARTQEVAYLATAKAPSVIEMVGVAAVGAWLGVLIGAGGLLLLWVSHRLDPNGVVRSNKVPARKRRVAR